MLTLGNWFGLVLGHINHCRLFNAKSCLYFIYSIYIIWCYGISIIVGYLMANPFYTYKQFYFKQCSLVNKVKWFQVLLCIPKNLVKHHSFFYSQLNIKTVLFQTIQFNISTQFCSLWSIDRTLSGDTTPGQTTLGSESNEGLLRIPNASALLKPHHQFV